MLIRLAKAPLTLLICVTFAFLLLRSAGDPLASLLPDDMPPDGVEIYRERLAIDCPLCPRRAGGGDRPTL